MQPDVGQTGLLLCLWGAMLFFWGLARVPLAQGVALSFIAPLIALYLAALLLKERIERTAILASLSAIEMTVIDEADHMADLGFLPVVTKILDKTPSSGQRLLFSATLDNGVDKLVRRFLQNEVLHSVDEATSHVADMTHHLFEIDSVEEAEMRGGLIDTRPVVRSERERIGLALEPPGDRPDMRDGRHGLLLIRADAEADAVVLRGDPARDPAISDRGRSRAAPPRRCAVSFSSSAAAARRS